MWIQASSLLARQKFEPGWLGVIVNPFYFARRGLFRAMQELAPQLNGYLLDVGCGSKPYKKLCNAEKYIGLDIDTQTTRKIGTADCLYDGMRFPFGCNVFDSILCNQVLEHVFHPDLFLSEINRVLKPGGRLLITVPFVWDEHEQPLDYARYSSYGLGALLEKHGFIIHQKMKLNPDVRVIFQITNAYLFKIVAKWPRHYRWAATVTVMALVNVLGIALSKILPSNPDLYLDLAVMAEKIS